MGNCSPNRLDQYSSVYFDVYNVDASLFQHSKGQMQITNEWLILHQKNSHADEQQIKWPLNGVRRYGYYKDIFLFESGRRCDTGEGLYAFKCSKAKRLNEVLHKIILNNAMSLSGSRSHHSHHRHPTSLSGGSDSTSTSAGARPTNSARLSSSLSANIAAHHRIPIATITTTTDDESSRILADAEQPQPNEVSILYQNSSSLSDNRPQSPPASSHYVNDLRSLVRLPINLSTANMDPHGPNSQTNNGRTSDYINGDHINQDLLHLAKKINNINDPPPASNYSSVQSKSSKSSLTYEKLKGALSSSSSKLNYIIPEMLSNSKSHMRTRQSGKNLDRVSESEPQAECKSKYARKTSQNSTAHDVEYCTINFNNTNALTTLMKQRSKDSYNRQKSNQSSLN